MGAEASAVLLQAKDPQLLQLEMVRKHSLAECGEGQPYSHDGWAQTSRGKNWERALSFTAKFVVVHYESYNREESSPRAALVLGIELLPPLNQDVSAVEELRVDRLLQDEPFPLFNKDFVALLLHAVGTEDRATQTRCLAF